MSTLDDEKKLKAQWKRYRNHKSKNAAWVFLELYNKGATKLEDFKECVKESIDEKTYTNEVLGNSYWEMIKELMNL